jgi:uncharacterized membrane protein YkvI
MVDKKGVSTLKVAGAYIGTVVGAGFATGQEILQFFNRFGVMGLAGLAVTTTMFIVFGYIIMVLGRKLKARSHMEIIMYSGGKKIGAAIDKIVTFFLLCSFIAMISGTGAMFAQQFNLPVMYGNILMTVLTAATVLTGIGGVINSISFIVPFTLTGVAVISILSIAHTPLSIIPAMPLIGENRLLPNWIFAAILYVSYNIILSVAVLGPLGSEARDMKAVRNGVILGGLGLGLGSLMIYLTLSGNIWKIAHVEIPMMYIAGKISRKMQYIYSAVLIAEIYTTAVGSFYGFISRITNLEKQSVRSGIIVVVSAAIALIASQLGFSNLVKYLYPIEGCAGILLLISLIYSWFFTRRSVKLK